MSTSIFDILFEMFVKFYIWIAHGNSYNQTVRNWLKTSNAKLVIVSHLKKQL